LLPVNAISSIADSKFVVGMARGRAWVMVLGVLLTGIVALNVLGLSLSAAGSDTSMKVDELQQQNSVLRGRIAHRLSTKRISEAASALGLSVPAPDAVRYLDSRSGDAERAAKRLAAGEIAAGAAPIATADPAATDPATIDPAATDPATIDPATIDPTMVDPAAIDPAVAATTSTVDPALDPTATAP
jgi:preprotein translocase subunit SecD